MNREVAGSNPAGPANLFKNLLEEDAVTRLSLVIPVVSTVGVLWPTTVLGQDLLPEQQEV